MRGNICHPLSTAIVPVVASQLPTEPELEQHRVCKFNEAHMLMAQEVEGRLTSAESH